MSPANSSFQRTDRVADLMQREIADILLKEVKDPRVGFVTITAVRLTKDLKNARVFFTTLKEGEDLENAVEGLRNAAGFVQRKVGGRLQLRNTPHITFAYDSSFETGAHMDRILREIEESRPPDAPDKE
jgi:ribosome-binding factor A